MMGKDIESLLTKIDGIKPLVVDMIKTLSTSIATVQNAYNDPEATPTLPTASGIEYLSTINSNFQTVASEINKLKDRDKKYIKPLYEKSSPSIFASLEAYMESIKEETDKFQSIKGKMFSKATEFFNSLGSPFSEFETLMESYNNAKEFASAHSEMKYYGEKVGMLSLIQPIIPCVADFKVVLITYNDYIQRGYDTLYNDNNPSITIKRSKDGKSTGNIDQNTNNVKIKPKSLDPY